MLPLGPAELIRKPRSSAHGDHAMSRCGSARTGQMILHVGDALTSCSTIPGLSRPADCSFAQVLQDLIHIRLR